MNCTKGCSLSTKHCNLEAKVAFVASRANHSDVSPWSEDHRIRLPDSSAGRKRSTTAAPSGVSLAARCATTRSTGSRSGSISRYTPTSGSQRMLPVRTVLVVSTVSVLHVSSRRPIAASRRMARRWDSTAARPSPAATMTHGSSAGGGASSKTRRAHLPSRRPRRFATAPDQDALGTSAAGDISQDRRQ